MDKQVLAVWAKTMADSQKTQNQEAEKGRFWAFSGVPGKCRESAGVLAKLGGGENTGFESLESVLKNADKDAEKELSHKKAYAKLLKSHLSGTESRNRLVAFMRYHSDVKNTDITACIMSMLHNYVPAQPANAKQLATIAAASVPDIKEWFARDKVFSLLVDIGVITPRDGIGYIWTDLAANQHKTRDAAIDLLKRAAKPAYPELYDEQRKLAAAIKANDLAKRRQEIARSTAAIIANTDQLPHIQRDSNTKVVLAAVAAVLFAGGVLVAKYGDSQPQQTKTQEITQEQSAPMFDVEKMLAESNPSFYKLPMEEQARLIDQAKQAFAE